MAEAYLTAALSRLSFHGTPLTFDPFPRLPFELRLKIYKLLISPRYIHYDRNSALHTNLFLDPVIPPLLHVNSESRTFALSQYTLYTFGARQLYLNPILDIVLWIRYTGSTSSSRTFRADALRLVQETSAPNPPLELPNLAISKKFWGRIVRKEIYRELYDSIRGGVGRIYIVDDAYGVMDVEKLRGARVRLSRRNKVPAGGNEELWRWWDELASFGRADEEAAEQLPEVRFKRAVFVLKR